MIARTIVSLEDPTGNNAAQGKVALVEHAWLYLLMLNLFGYAVFGKGWAYLGYPPVFIGELLLLCGLMVVFLSGRWSLFFQSWLLGPIYLLAIWEGCAHFLTCPSMEYLLYATPLFGVLCFCRSGFRVRMYQARAIEDFDFWLWLVNFGVPVCNAVYLDPVAISGW